MNVIYEPRGAAAEYSPLAANLYRGCGHGCLYCYAPDCLRMSREAFSSPAVRPRVLEALRKDAARFQGDDRPILLCFTCDPYQPLEAEEGITRRAIEILGEAGLRIRVLTKNGKLAMRDLRVMARYNVEFGVSLAWADDTRRQEWEPYSGTVCERLEGLARAAAAGLATWVSMEPVIDPQEALAALNCIAGPPRRVGIIKIGKLNHDKAREATIDWLEFARRAIEICRHAGQAYYIKNDLWRACAGRLIGRQHYYGGGPAVD